jgi:HlyD family secretion protein
MAMATEAPKKRKRIWILVVIGVAALGFFGWKFWQSKQGQVPKGIAWGNGRVEAKLADVSAKEPLRVKDVLVNEGDLVQPGQVLVHLDTNTLEAQLAESKAAITAAQSQMAVANASIIRRKSEIALARTEVARSQNMLKENAASQREVDVRTMMLASTTAALAEEQARLQSAKEQVAVSEANAATVQTRIEDATLKSPVNGRVLYRLAEPGEVLGPGGKALTLVNLEDVYMEIFLPAEQASQLKMGSEGRITFDYAPGRSVSGVVTFVSPEAQFTPKEVETRSEREKLMFRVKISVPKELVLGNIERIKTGVRGVGYVKVDPSVPWPAWLSQDLVPAKTAAK